MKPSDLNFEFCSHISFSTGAERLEKAVYNGLIIYKIITTRKSLINGWGKGKTTYSIGKEKKQYKTLEELSAALSQKQAADKSGCRADL